MCCDMHFMASVEGPGQVFWSISAFIRAGVCRNGFSSSYNWTERRWCECGDELNDRDPPGGICIRCLTDEELGG